MINDANQNIKQTSKLLDIDVFLKKQKDKRMQYAKDLNAEFDIQKKIREEKLYKQYNRS